ncbi:serine/arginine-rich splicing factor SR45a [Pelomyxa schiedti]|nr:serine/arginine-rich splicing factor SR45a [Pelomyxa schiedti]
MTEQASTLGETTSESTKEEQTSVSRDANADRCADSDKGGIDRHPTKEQPVRERRPSESGRDSSRDHDRNTKSDERSRSHGKDSRTGTEVVSRRNESSPARKEGRSRSRSRSPQREYGRRDSAKNSVALYVSGLSSKTREADLSSKLEHYGTVLRIKLVRDPRTHESRGFAFVTMSSKEEADEIIQKMNRTELDGRQILIEKARRDRSRSPTPGHYLGLDTIHRRPSSSRTSVSSRSSAPTYPAVTNMVSGYPYPGPYGYVTPPGYGAAPYYSRYSPAPPSGYYPSSSRLEHVPTSRSPSPPRYRPNTPSPTPERDFGRSDRDLDHNRSRDRESEPERYRQDNRDRDREREFRGRDRDRDRSSRY